MDKRKPNKLEIEVQTTVMAVREELMSYFKGGCVQKLIKGANVHTMPTRTNVGYDFQRRGVENARPSVIVANDIVIITMRYRPEKITFHQAGIDKNKLSREVGKRVEEFVKEYLGAIEVKFTDEPLQMMPIGPRYRYIQAIDTNMSEIAEMAGLTLRPPNIQWDVLDTVMQTSRSTSIDLTDVPF